MGCEKVTPSNSPPDMKQKRSSINLNPFNKFRVRSKNRSRLTSEKVSSLNDVSVNSTNSIHENINVLSMKLNHEKRKISNGKILAKFVHHVCNPF